MSGFKQREWRFGICALGLGTILSGCTGASVDGQNNLPYRLSVTSHFPLPILASYKFADLDDVEGAEIISISASGGKYALQFYRQPNAPPINKFEFAGRLIPDSTPLDLDHDGRKEYFVCEQIGDSAKLYAVWPFEKSRLQKIYAIKSVVDSTTNNSTSIHVRDLIDVNDDGQDELILYVTANIGQPSSLMALTWKTGKRRWNLKVTGSINGYVNRRPEILLTTVGGGSKLRVNGKTPLDDKHSYLVSVNSETGGLEHAQAFGPSFTTIALYSPAELNLPPSRADQFLLVMSLPDRRGAFEVWDAPARRSVAQQEVPELQWHFMADIDRDHIRDIVFMNGANDWQGVAADLQPLAAFPKTLTFPAFVTVPALPDNQPPVPIHLPRSSGAQVGIVAQLSNRAGFMVFDDQLRPLAAWDEGLAIEFSAMPQGKYDDLFWATPEHVYFFRLEPVAKFDVARFTRGMLLLLGLAAVLYFLFWQIRKRAQHVIDRLLQVMQGLEIGACVLQPPGRIVKINQQGKKILGLGDHDLSKHPIQEVLADNQYAELCKIINNGVHNGAFVPQSCILHQAQTEKEIEALKISLDAVLNRNRMEVLLLRDVTAQYAAQKTTFWAKTAQRLAHDLKTPLSNILMSIDHLSREYGLQQSSNGNGEPKENYIDYIRSEVARMRKRTIGFVKFTELEKPKFEPLPANDLLLAAAMTFEPMFGERIQLNKELEENLPLVMVDAKQIRMALNNLLDNAIAAMSRQRDGVLTLRSYLVSSLPDSEGNAPQYVAMEIHDTGSGIPPEILQSINEQKMFVTTKPDGTGVGLVQVQQIIADHHGQFEIKSTPGVGTVVYLAVPT